MKWQTSCWTYRVILVLLDAVTSDEGGFVGGVDQQQQSVRQPERQRWEQHRPCEENRGHSQSKASWWPLSLNITVKAKNNFLHKLHWTEARDKIIAADKLLMLSGKAAL